MPAISGMLPKGNHRDKHTRPFTPSYGLPLNKNATNLQVAKRRYPQTPFPCSRGDRGSRGITSERWRLSQDVGIGGSTGEFFATPQESQESSAESVSDFGLANSDCQRFLILVEW